MEECKSLKRKKILDAAFKLFSEKGYDNTKIIDISAEAGIGKGTVYEYFKSKDSLFFQVFKDKIFSSYADISSIIEKEPTCKEKLKAAIVFELESAHQFGNSKNMMPYVFGEIENGMLNGESNDFFSAMHQLMMKKFQIIYDIINQGITMGEFKAVNPVMAATSLVGAMNFYLAFHYDVLPHTLHGEKFYKSFPAQEKEPWDIDQLLDIIMNGLKSRN
ncbi:MAG: TetR/AcrR family transcriptional regulator [Anaerovorax sp.]